MTESGTHPARPEGVTLRAAGTTDCRQIAELFRIASDGVVDYVWGQLQGEYPGLSPLEIGERRYRREGTPFSWQNCLLVEHEGRTVGMLHSFVVEASKAPPAPGDPVLQPYAELEVPGSLYIAGLALLPEYRGQGIGTRLIAAARERARKLGVSQLSLLVFADNRDAVRLYRREGFQEIERRPVVPHPLIRRTGEVLLMTAPV